MPENKGAPDASAIPRHNGTATKKTTILAGKSLFNSLNRFGSDIAFIFLIRKLFGFKNNTPGSIFIAKELELNVIELLIRKGKVIGGRHMALPFSIGLRPIIV